MKILETIIATKFREVEERKKANPAAGLERSNNFYAPTRSLKKSLREKEKSGIIAEFKRQSPSAGIINSASEISDVCSGYEAAGSSAISILTDKEYFGGDISDLQKIKGIVNVPLLRKDFIIDEYQVIESKSAGADAILLIAAALDRSKLVSLHRFALSLGLEVLIEVHDESCIEKLPPDAEITGINCRDLKSFTFRNDSFEKLVNSLSEHSVKVAESGISTPQQVVLLRESGFDGFLIGSLFMKSKDPGQSCMDFINTVKKLTT